MDLQVQRFITAHAILLAFKGLPGLYFHSLFGSRGWPEGVTQTGRKRSINREKLDQNELTAELRDAGSLRSQIYGRIEALVGRSTPPSGLFAAGCTTRSRRRSQHLRRASRRRGFGSSGLVHAQRERRTAVLSVQSVDGTNERALPPFSDVISAKPVDWQPEGILMLKPFQSMWLTI